MSLREARSAPHSGVWPCAAAAWQLPTRGRLLRDAPAAALARGCEPPLVAARCFPGTDGCSMAPRSPGV
eukprot:3968429-Heterocapsa_arctica.AAC.2